MEVVIAAIISAFIAVGVSWFVMALFNKKRETTYIAIESKAKELEKQIHINEANFLERKNRMEIAYREEQKLLRESTWNEGKAHGQSEGEKDHLIEITQLMSEYREKILQERNLAANEARSQARIEFELQSKLFGVVIKPYVKIEKDDSFLWASNKSTAGYQYQLLVNGIPAFQPHVVIEHTAESKEFNDTRLEGLKEIAIKAAQAAAELYFSGASSAVIKMGVPIIEEITKKNASKVSS